MVLPFLVLITVETPLTVQSKAPCATRETRSASSSVRNEQLHLDRRRHCLDAIWLLGASLRHRSGRWILWRSHSHSHSHACRDVSQFRQTLSRHANLTRTSFIRPLTSPQKARPGRSARSAKNGEIRPRCYRSVDHKAEWFAHLSRLGYSVSFDPGRPCIYRVTGLKKALWAIFWRQSFRRQRPRPEWIAEREGRFDGVVEARMRRLPRPRYLDLSGWTLVTNN
ncbi:hypothetical protein ACVWYO_004887 [Sphingomonas sp. UYP23]